MISKRNDNIILIEFGSYKRIRTPSLVQYDKGIIIEFMDVADGTEVHFATSSLVKTKNEVVKDGKAEIPDSVLEFGEEIIAYVYVVNIDSETTVKEVIIPVKTRVKPGDYIEPENEQTFREYVETVLEETKAAAQSAEEKVKNSEEVLTQIDDKTNEALENINKVADASIRNINNAANAGIDNLNSVTNTNIGNINTATDNGVKTVNDTAANVVVAIGAAQNEAINAIAQREGVAVGNINDTEARILNSVNRRESEILTNMNSVANQHVTNINNAFSENMADFEAKVQASIDEVLGGAY